MLPCARIEEPLSLHRPGQPCHPPRAVPDGCLGQLCQRKEENSLVCAKRTQSPTKTITLCTQMPVAFPTHVATSTSRRFGPSPGHVLAALANRSSSGKSAKPFPLRTLSETPRYHSPRALVLLGKTQPRAHVAMPRAPHRACRERCPGRAVGSIPHALQLPSIAGAKPTAGSWGGCRPSAQLQSEERGSDPAPSLSVSQGYPSHHVRHALEKQEEEAHPQTVKPVYFEVCLTTKLTCPQQS